MDTCELYQSQLLDHLYDLLEGDELQALQQHLADCAACRTALDRARNQQALLAAAAKMDFAATVSFEAPPAIIPLVGRGADGGIPLRRRRLTWVAAAAAVLLLLLGGLTWPAISSFRDYAAVKEEVETQERAIALARKHIKDAQGELGRADLERTRRETELRKAAEERQLKVVVSGPETVQPGAPNQFQIQTRSLSEQIVPAQLTVRVRDQAQQVLYEEKDLRSTGNFTLALPPNLPLKPNTRLSLEFLARRDGGPQEEVREELSLAQPVYVTHLTTDKPLYQPSETVHFRSLTLDRFSFKPPEEEFHLKYTLRKPSHEEVVILTGTSRLIREQNQKKVTVQGPDGKPIRGVGAGEFRLDASAGGGEYTLIVSEMNNRFPPQERKFLVNSYEKHNLEKVLEWSRKSYGEGDEVLANCKVTKAGGGAVKCQVQARVTIDGVTYSADGKPSDQPILLATDQEGKVAVRFHLPRNIDRGLGTLSVNFFDGASNETLNKPIPIVLKKLDIEFFPEGGDLVAGVSNRVYFQVRSTLGKPADLRGKIVDADGKMVKEGVETLTVADQPGANQGMGLFAFTPEADKKYELIVEAPIGIQGKYKLPHVETDKVALSIPQGVTAPGEPLRIIVHNPARDRSLLVGAYCRGRLMDHQSVAVKKGDRATVELRPSQEMGGVYRVTVFEQLPAGGNRRNLQPLAERLVYRQPSQHLQLAVRPDKQQYIPGDLAKLTVTAMDEKGQPAPAIILVGVVDRSVITMADDKTARTMPTHFYLTTEVRRPEDLEHADFLLTEHSRAKVALDLLLGTQGWRRFAEQNPTRFRQNGTDAERLVVAIGQSSTKTVDFLKKDLEQIDREFQEQVARLNDERASATETLQKAMAAPAYVSASSRLAKYRGFYEKLQTQTLPLVGVAILLVAFVALIVLAFRSVRRAAPLYAGAGACAMLLLGVLVFQVEREKSEAIRLAERLAEDNRPKPQVAMAPAAPMPMDDKAAPWPDAEVAKNAQGMMPPAPMMPAPPPAGRAPRAAHILKPMTMPKTPDGLKGGPARERAGAALDQNRMLNKKLDEGLEKEQQEFKQVNGDRPQVGGGGAANKPALEQVDRRAPGLAAGLPFGLGGIRAGVAPVMIPPQPPPPPLVVREYAHIRSADARPEVRNDFTETVYWNPVLVLPDGKGEVSFNLSDAVTSFEVAVMGHGLDGRIGSVTTDLASRLPFSLAPKLPIEVTSSDKIDVPVSIANNTSDPRSVSLRLSTVGLALREGSKQEDQLTVPANKSVRRVLRLQPNLVEGVATLELVGEARPFAIDTIRRTFPVVPDGFPVIVSRSDVLEKVGQYEVDLPQSWVKGTLQLKAEVYPSTLADLQKGLEALLREPGGCFEQTSTSNYPNLLILDYLKETEQAKPEIEQRALAMLDRGYRQLTGFECPYGGQTRHGYEWFGAADSAHEALTAYGLLEFRDMARVYKVDPAMVERTRQYLLDQRDGKGGFKRNPRALDSFGRAPEDITNAYIIWALTESGKEDDVTKELDTLASQAKTSKDPYFLGLVANSLLNRDRAADGIAMLKALADLQKDEGHLDATRTSITGSGGRDLQIETTALAVLGWLKANRPAEFNQPVQKAIKWIGQQRGGYGGFGSTQSTILALKALIGFAKANKRTTQAGELRLFVREKCLATRSFEAGTQDALTVTLPDAEKHLKAGKNPVRVEISGDKNVFPCTLSWTYRTVQPISAGNAPVQLTAKLDRQNAAEGDTVHLTVTLRNTQDKGQGMAVAIVGLPAGLSLPEDLKQLKQHAELRNNGTERGLISYFETRGRELVLYWRDMAPNQKIEVPVDLICRVPGEYRGPASRSYLYYNSDTKFWVEPLQMTIMAKE